MNIYDPLAEALGLPPSIDVSEYPSKQQLLEDHPPTSITGQNITSWNKGKKYKANAPYTKERCKNISLAKKGKVPFFKNGHPGAKPVICNETKEVYPTGRAAAAAHGGSYQNMSNHLYGRQKTFRGLTFSFYKA